MSGERVEKTYEAIILGTGYTRQAWKEILFKDLNLPPVESVTRNYRLMIPKILPDSNPSSHGSEARRFKPTVWLQGCNEATHGISDSLLR